MAIEWEVAMTCNEFRPEHNWHNARGSQTAEGIFSATVSLEWERARVGGGGAMIYPTAFALFTCTMSPLAAAIGTIVGSEYHLDGLAPSHG